MTFLFYVATAKTAAPRDTPRSLDGIFRASASMPVFERGIAHMHVQKHKKLHFGQLCFCGLSNIEKRLSSV